MERIGKRHKGIEEKVGTEATGISLRMKLRPTGKGTEEGRYTDAIPNVSPSRRLYEQEANNQVLGSHCWWVPDRDL